MLVRSPDVIEQRLLEEYREQGLCWRHDDEVFSKLTAVLLPLSIAALTLPYLKDGAPKLLAASGGLMLIAYWFFSSESHEDRLNIRWSRIHEIERILGFDSHLRMDKERKRSVWKGRPLRWCVFILYIVIALFVMCDIKVGTILWSFDWWIIKFAIKITTLVITTETIAFLFIVGIGVIGVRIWIWIRDRKGSNPENNS